MRNKYVLFGAGKFGTDAVNRLGKENILFFVDNYIKAESKLGVPIYRLEMVKERIEGEQVLVTVGRELKDEIMEQLRMNGVTNVTYIEDLYCAMRREKIATRMDYISVYNNAVAWIHRHTVNGEAIINNTALPKPYPEVTGYYIPSLLQWGYKEEAIAFAKWICHEQGSDGAWYDTEKKSPYVFDSAQALKGLLAIRTMLPTVDEHILRGCDWILSRMDKNGRLITPSTDEWGDNTDVCDEVVHIYCLSPLIEAARIFDRPEYAEKAERVFSYYEQQYHDKIMNFSLLSHFYAYLMEALLDLGKEEMAREAMAGMTAYQKESGAIPAYHDVDWVCSTGMFQLAAVWYRLGDVERADRTFSYACGLQNASGGWNGSYLSEDNPNEVNTYFPNAEISWCNKFFLDALYWKNKAAFDAMASEFRDSYPLDDGRYQVIEKIVGKAAERENAPRILDVGCGKGAYLKNLLRRVPNAEYFGVDLSEKVMSYIGVPAITAKQGSLTNIPFEDSTFDLVYTCEAMEHAIDIQSAVREMARVAKPGGTIVILDKSKEKLGALDIEEWEQWFDEQELTEIMKRWCDEVHVIKEIGFDNEPANGLFYAWVGKVR